MYRILYKLVSGITLHQTYNQEVRTMFNKKMKLIGVSILVCLAALVVIPAFAAAPAQGSSTGHTMTAAGEAKLLGFAENRTASLQQKGVDVTNLNAALANAKIAVQNSDQAAFLSAMKTFNQDIQAGIKDGSIPQTDLAGAGHQGFQKNGANPPVLNATMESKMLTRAENLTTTLQQKGVDVTNLNAALSSAQSAIQSANATAFKDAMKTFNQDIQAGIKDGSIPQTALAGTGRQGLQKNGATPLVLNATMETKMLTRAENLTTTLQQKGVDVTNLNAALANAKTALQNADTTAFKDAMKTFNQDIQAGIKSGSIDKSVLPQQRQRPASATGTSASTTNHVKNTGSTPST